MLSVGRKLRRVGKAAFKFKFFATFHSVTLQGKSGLELNQASMAWTRGNRTARTKDAKWSVGKDTTSDEEGVTGIVAWNETCEMVITLYKDSKGNIESKEYKLLLEQSTGSKGTRSLVASATIDMARFVSLTAEDKREIIQLKSNNKRVVRASVDVKFACEFLKEGSATDDDMMSTWSRLSTASGGGGGGGGGQDDDDDDAALQAEIRERDALMEDEDDLHEDSNANATSGAPDKPAEAAKAGGNVFTQMFGFITGSDKKDDKQGEDKKSGAPSHPANPAAAPAIVIDAADDAHGSAKGKKDKEKEKEKDREKEHQREREKDKQHIRLLESEILEMKETIRNLTQKVAELSDALESAKGEGERLATERKELIAQMDINGWLLKLGEKGLIKLWRRRWFSCDASGRIYYYKHPNDTEPLGFIDIDKVTQVRVQVEPMQDKNHASFVVSVPGRDYYLMAMDGLQMDHWIQSLEFIRKVRKEQSQPKSSA